MVEQKMLYSFLINSLVVYDCKGNNESYKIFNLKKLEEALLNYFYHEFKYDDNVDVMNFEDDLENLKSTGIISLAYTTTDDDEFNIHTFLDMNELSVFYTKSQGDKIHKKIKLYEFKNEEELLNIIDGFSFDTLITDIKDDVFKVI